MPRKLTREIFIERARKIHGDKYDYSKVVYVNNSTFVTIICPEHGEFSQRPSVHLRGGECPICGRKKCDENRRLGTEKFIKKAREIHGDKYDYSKVVYVSAHEKVIIICSIHGEFLQTPTAHLSGKGCKLCANKYIGDKKILGRECFIEKALKIHGDKYDYSKVVYVNNSTPITITCPVHGEFLQAPNNHLQGQECPKCVYERIGNKTPLTTESFIYRARNIHGDKYDYSKVAYINIKTPVIIICPIHGEFQQTPAAHLSGKGCLKCGLENASWKKIREYGEAFISKSMKIHHGKYQYSDVIYKGNSIPVDIICPIHGRFQQTPAVHLMGCGCPKCQSSHLEKATEFCLQVNNIRFESQKKFPWLRNIKSLSLDFYLTEYNIAIECQGEQHLTMRTKLRDKKFDYKAIIKRDNIKNKLCQENGIELLYLIPNCHKALFESNKVFPDVVNLYNKDNTFFSLEELMKYIQSNGYETKIKELG